ncbi:MAG: site-specific integrase [Gemmataceae bacterium]
MAPTSSIPAYRLHKPSGQAVVTLRINGIRRDVYLGRFNSAESRREYGRLLAEAAARPSVSPVANEGAAGPTVAEVMVAYMRFALGHYRRADGTHTSEIDEIKRSLCPVRRLYESKPAAEFGPLALAAVRRVMMERSSGTADDSPVLSRPVINRRVDRIKRMFRWAASQELVPVTVYEALRTLAGLQRGRTTAPEPPPVKPVDPVDVAKTLPFLGPHLRAMVELQRVTGMRPGEVCSMKLSEIDSSAEPWTYRPAHHKTLHHGRDRVIMIGPRGRAVLEAFLAAIPATPNEGPLFSPKRAREERFAKMRQNRKTPVQPSQLNRRLRKPKLVPKDEYTPHTFAHAVRVAARKAGAKHWHPNQLRHLYASEIRKSHGLEAAQVLLGHSRADITQIYAERNLSLAAEVALRAG